MPVLWTLKKNTKRDYMDGNIKGYKTRCWKILYSLGMSKEHVEYNVSVYLTRLNIGEIFVLVEPNTSKEETN